jgi:hypothetical protein
VRTSNPHVSGSWRFFFIETFPVLADPLRIMYKNIVVKDNTKIFCFEFNAELLS